ncbi:hypothetical protein [Aquisalimonas sp.]|uniref:hypothetical protein n=1 Tax=unclassified Aquisalimonas TaxID=2644645 RepID=UPI0025C6647C|nr:hypothetical protein [Aquisalimonas sp.]
MEIEPWGIWLLLALGLFALELVLMGGAGGLFLAWALMALAAMAAALLDASIMGQLITAGVAGLVAMPGVIWLFRSATEGGAGEAGTPTAVTIRHGKAGVIVRGEFFQARHEDGRELRQGDSVLVVRYQGLTAIVKDADAGGTH